MMLSFTLGGRDYRIDASAPIDISIPLRFNDGQPGAFHIPAATAQALEGGGFVGDTRRGGSCNCETVSLNPHGNGTHTECVGHITDSRMYVGEMLRETFMPATLVTVQPERAEAADQEEGVRAAGDHAVTRAMLEAALNRVGPAREFLRALVVRTEPNEPSRLTAQYSDTNPPYLTTSAMLLVRELGVEHLLVDLPSVDREDDDTLAAHRVFWSVPERGHEIERIDMERTITEMIYVSDAVPDGAYMLGIQVPRFMLDAAPSRPMLFSLMPAG